MNASTFTARVITSTGADVAAAFSGAIGAMSGPLHGGAPVARPRDDRGGREARRRRVVVRQGAARQRRAADGLRPPRLPRRGPARPRAAPHGQGARRARATRSPRRWRRPRWPSSRSVVPTACWRPTSSSGRPSSSTSPRCRRTCSPRCSPAPARAAGRRTSSSRRLTGRLIRPSAVYAGPSTRPASEVEGWDEAWEERLAPDRSGDLRRARSTAVRASTPHGAPVQIAATVA